MSPAPRGFGARGTLSIEFATFRNLANVTVDGECHGYMEHRDGATRIHVGKGAPVFLLKARIAGPYDNHATAQAAIREAAVGVARNEHCPDCGLPVTTIFDHVDGCPGEIE